VPEWLWMQRSHDLGERFDFEDELLAADAPTMRDAEFELGEPWKPETLVIRSLDASERERFRHRWLAEVRAQLLVDPVVAAEQADVLVQEMMRARGYPVDPFDWHLGVLSAGQAEVVRHYHDAQDVALTHDSRHAVRAVQQYHHLFDELIESSDVETITQ
jgi:hypothetical protein